MFGLVNPWMILGVVLAFVGAYVTGEYRGRGIGASNAELACERTLADIKNQLDEKERQVRIMLEEQVQRTTEIVEERALAVQKEVEDEAKSQELVDQYEARLKVMSDAWLKSQKIPNEDVNDVPENLDKGSCTITNDDAASLRPL